ncbi:hypothetical protein K435DRAFT_357760 [Dendrothele bispora CBS 962.96]|uniref:DUF6534 domain-containing protein n=1 Tax=Dendrothele bispora (strain CBS 962.96) TaxID=1314807 RepID=A0A4S8LE55_DENBC|nr:hypothetical protein K435DRAFT_357760 [Dendrothele bispora CBS 962.96]
MGVGIIICLGIQNFFVRAIYQLTQGKWRITLTANFIFLMLGQVGFGIFYVSKEFQLWGLDKIRSISEYTFFPMLVFRTTFDLISAVSLSLVLYNFQPELRPSIKLVKALITYAMQRFMLTTFVAIAQTVLFFIELDDRGGAMAIEYVMVHLYVNSFLATLNARNRLRGSMEGNFATVSSLPSRDPGILFDFGLSFGLEDGVANDLPVAVTNVVVENDLKENSTVIVQPSGDEGRVQCIQCTANHSEYGLDATDVAMLVFVHIGLD